MKEEEEKQKALGFDIGTLISSFLACFGALYYFKNNGQKKFIMFLCLLLAITVIVLFFKVKQDVTKAWGADASNVIFLVGGIFSFIFVFIVFVKSDNDKKTDAYKQMN